MWWLQAMDKRLDLALKVELSEAGTSPRTAKGSTRSQRPNHLQPEFHPLKADVLLPLCRAYLKAPCCEQDGPILCGAHCFTLMHSRQ